MASGGLAQVLLLTGVFVSGGVSAAALIVLRDGGDTENAQTSSTARPSDGAVPGERSPGPAPTAAEEIAADCPDCAIEPEELENARSAADVLTELERQYVRAQGDEFRDSPDIAPSTEATPEPDQSEGETASVKLEVESDSPTTRVTIDVGAPVEEVVPAENEAPVDYEPEPLPAPRLAERGSDAREAPAPRTYESEPARVTHETVNSNSYVAVYGYPGPVVYPGAFVAGAYYVPPRERPTVRGTAPRPPVGWPAERADARRHDPWAPIDYSKHNNPWGHRWGGGVP